ncbi:cytochrome P450 6B5-like [Battus philenor]|uniref:cytochrome P450 6B5-like n=1 Tax=Battus philenor TaxID=42288 RepID=UPI0035CEA8D3
MILKILVLCISLCAIYYLVRLYNEIYWRKRGVKFYKKYGVFGPLGEYLTTDRPLFDIIYDIYKAHPDEPAVGFGALFTKALYVKDPVNVQHVLNQDFNSFNHRGVEMNEEDHLANNILFMMGDRWKLMRQTMTPLFTSAKLKNMFYIIDRSAQDLVDYLKKNPGKMKDDVLNTLCTFSCAATGAAVFGIGSDSIFKSPFLPMAMKVLKPTLKRNMKIVLCTVNTFLYKLLGLTLFKDYEEFFITVIKQVIRKREEENVKKHDYADLCVNLKRKGLLKDPDTGFELQLTDELLAAQAFVFFIAGVEPTAASMFSTLVNLGLHPEILKRAQEEIDNTFERCNSISFDTIQELEYLDMVHCESMRIYPSIGYLSRQCTNDTVLPVGNIKVDKGTLIFTPIFEYHHDPNIYPDPEVFNPERFSSENRTNISDYTYMPFGRGKRLCIGTRYASLQVKTVLFYLLRNFSVRTHVLGSGIKYSKQNVQVRASNLRIEFIPRDS